MMDTLGWKPIKVWVLLTSDLTGELDEPSNTALYQTRQKAVDAMEAELLQCAYCGGPPEHTDAEHVYQPLAQLEGADFKSVYGTPNVIIRTKDGAYRNNEEGLTIISWAVYEQEVN